MKELTELQKQQSNLKNVESEVKEAKEKIRVLQEERDTLLKEVNYRVKNNLQIISSFLRLQSKTTKNKQLLNAFNDSLQRVRSIALIHEILSQNEGVAGFSFKEYLSQLTSKIFNLYGADSEFIKINIEVDGILDVERSVSCGLIISELVSNSLKYAFPTGKKGEIIIRFFRQENNCVMIVGDNGVGFPKNIDIKTTNSLGLNLVNVLSTQLNSEIDIERTNGTLYKLIFPNN